MLVRSEVPAFAVVAVVGEEELRSDEEDLGVEKEDAAVVADAVVENRHAQVHEDVVRQVGEEERGQRFVAVQEGVLLQEVVLAAVPAHFELLFV